MTKYAQERKYIIDSIDGSSYGKDLKTDKEKLQFLFDCFNQEYGWHIEQIGQFEALQNWLMGLPSAINIVFENYKILELAKFWGSLPANATEKQEYKILGMYWRFMAMRILGLWRDYDIN